MQKMSLFPQLNFPGYSFRLRACGGGDRIWDELRKMWLVLTPEEWVRRHVVRWLVEEHKITPQLVVQECPVNVNGQPQRADIVVFDGNARPLLLVECKEPDVVMSPAVYAQAVRYNTVLDARYVMITNGLKHFIFERTPQKGYRQLRTFPELEK